MRLLLAALLVLALASPAVADAYGRIARGDVVAKDVTSAPIVNTFFQSVGSCEEGPNDLGAVYGTNVAIGDEPVAADTMDILVGSGGMPGWFLLQFPEETNLTVAFVRFKESVSGSAHSYTWGDWVPLYIGGEYREFAFNTGLWDSCHVCLAGSAYGLVFPYWRMELISDD